MQNDVNEFVFRRKRKRLQTLDSQGAEAVVPLDQASENNLHSGLIPEIAVLSQPRASSPTFPDSGNPTPSESIITVEQFLRRSVQPAPKSKRAASGDISLKRSRAYTHHRAPERRAARTRQVTRASNRPRRSSGIAKTLFRAAILTDGVPLDTLLDAAEVPRTRLPLKFVPFNKFSSPPRADLTHSTAPSDIGRVHTRRRGNTSGRKQHHDLRAPLWMVPLQEAEAAYCAMFPLRHVF